jgi:hypothetical protein
MSLLGIGAEINTINSTVYGDSHVFIKTMNNIENIHCFLFLDALYNIYSDGKTNRFR